MALVENGDLCNPRGGSDETCKGDFLGTARRFVKVTHSITNTPMNFLKYLTALLLCDCVVFGSVNGHFLEWFAGSLRENRISTRV